MKFNEFPIEHYVQLLQARSRFAFVGYSDAEWYSMIRHDLGKLTGLGQVIDEHAGNRLTNVMIRRQHDPRWMFAVPKCLWEWDECVRARVPRLIEECLNTNEITLDAFYERDMVLDDLAHAGGLYPLIHQLQQMKTCIISNEALRGLGFLNYSGFVEIKTPNLHMVPYAIEHAAEAARKYQDTEVFLVSAGVSAALIIDQIYDYCLNAIFIDCGSIWDAFVGIGSQRGWRQWLYDNPQELIAWRERNLNGTN